MTLTDAEAKRGAILFTSYIVGSIVSYFMGQPIVYIIVAAALFMLTLLIMREKKTAIDSVVVFSIIPIISSVTDVKIAQILFIASITYIFLEEMINL